MPNYRDIYDAVIAGEANYNLAEHSPGYQNCVEAAGALSLLGGRSLDIGCGVGFVIEYLAASPFRFEVWGVDASQVAVDRARARLNRFPRTTADRIQTIADQRLPFEADFFSLVTCFDVLEHLDERDIVTTLAEAGRVLRRGGVFFCSVSCRPSGWNDLQGENLHRTVRGVDWWIETAHPDRATFDAARSQLVMWKRNFKNIEARPA